jgi:hypothetical protein
LQGRCSDIIARIRIISLQGAPLSGRKIVMGLGSIIPPTICKLLRKFPHDIASPFHNGFPLTFRPTVFHPGTDTTLVSCRSQLFNGGGQDAVAAAINKRIMPSRKA